MLNADAQRLSAHRGGLPGVGPAGVRGALRSLRRAQPDPLADIRLAKDKMADAAWHCPQCDGIHPEYRKPALLANGRWTAKAEGDGKTVGFHPSSLYSPWLTWGRDRPGAPRRQGRSWVRIEGLGEHQTG